MIYSCVYSWVVGFPLSQHVPRTLITRNFSTSSPASTMACAWSGARGKPSNRQPFSFTSSCNKRSWKTKRGAGPQGGRIPGGQQIMCIYIHIYINRYRYICDYILIYFVYMILDALGFMPRTLRMHKSTSPLNYTQLLHQIHNQLAWHQPQHSARPWADPESAISGGW